MIGVSDRARKRVRRCEWVSSVREENYAVLGRACVREVRTSALARRVRKWMTGECLCVHARAYFGTASVISGPTSGRAHSRAQKVQLYSSNWLVDVRI